MEKYYFENEENRKRLGQVLDAWLGAPFRHWGGTRAGVDCIHFVIRVLEETGAIEKNRLKIPKYSKNWHLHQKEELFLEYIQQHFPVEEVPLSLTIDGDIILLHFGHVCSHAAIYFERRLYQAIDGIGVKKLPAMDRKWHKRKRYSFRILS